MLNPKVRQRVVVDRHASQDPPIRIVLLGQALQRSRAAHALDRGVQPQRHDRSVGRWPAAPQPPPPTAPCAYRGLRSSDSTNSHTRTRRVIRRQEAFQVHSAQLHLGSVGQHQPRLPFARRLASDLRFRLGKGEQGLAHAQSISRTRANRNRLSGISSQPLRPQGVGGSRDRGGHHRPGRLRTASRVLKGVPSLDGAALAAVQSWTFQPASWTAHRGRPLRAERAVQAERPVSPVPL